MDLKKKSVAKGVDTFNLAHNRDCCRSCELGNETCSCKRRGLLTVSATVSVYVELRSFTDLVTS